MLCWQFLRACRKYNTQWVHYTPPTANRLAPYYRNPAKPTNLAKGRGPLARWVYTPNT